MSKLLRFIIILIFTISATQKVHAQFNERYFFYVGQGLIIDGKYNEAIEMLSTLIRVDNDSYEGYFLRGIAKYNLGDYVGAESDFTTAININSVYTDAYHYRAISRSFLGDFDNSIRDFDSAIDIRPDKEGIFYSRGIAYYMNQQFDNAIIDFDYYIRKKPYVVDAYINRGSCYLMKKDTTMAFVDYNNAIRINRYDAGGYMRRGGLYLATNKLDSAYIDLTKSLELDSTLVAAYFNRAIVNSNRNNPMGALEDFSSVLKLDTMNSLTYFNRALVYSQIGDYENALNDYDKVEEYSPSNILLYYNRGGLNMKLGELKSAEYDFSKAIEIYPDFANAYLNRSAARYYLGDMEGSKKDKMIAEDKINKYKSNLQDSSLSIYADTSQFFNKLISFDVDFGNKDFENIKRNDVDVKVLPMFKITYANNFEIKKNIYYNNDYINEFKDNKKIKDVEFTIKTDVSEDKLNSLLSEYTEDVNSKKVTWEDYFNLALVQSSLQQYSKAIENYTKAIKLNPDNAFLYVNRAVARAEMIDFISKLSSKSDKMVIDAQPDKVLKAVRQEYSYAECIQDMQLAIRINPNISQFFYNLGNLLSLEGEQAEAIEIYTHAISLNPNIGELYFNRGMIQLHVKDTQKGYLDISKAGELGIEGAYQLLERFKK
ncbi:MAG: tetratricopeptide repeat protein [Rikenellaceae bacterium]